RFQQRIDIYFSLRYREQSMVRFNLIGRIASKIVIHDFYIGIRPDQIKPTMSLKCQLQTTFQINSFSERVCISYLRGSQLVATDHIDRLSKSTSADLVDILDCLYRRCTGYFV